MRWSGKSGAFARWRHVEGVCQGKQLVASGSCIGDVDVCVTEIRTATESCDPVVPEHAAVNRDRIKVG